MMASMDSQLLQALKVSKQGNVLCTQESDTAVTAAEQLQLLAQEGSSAEGAFTPQLARALGTAVLAAFTPDTQQVRLLAAALTTLLTWCSSADFRAAIAEQLPLEGLVGCLEDGEILCQALTTHLLQLLGTLATDGQARRRMQKAASVPVLTHLLAAAAAAHQRPPAAFVNGAATLHSLTAGRAASSGGAGGKVEAYKAWQRLQEVLLGALSNLLTQPDTAASCEQRRLFVDAGGLDAVACLLVQQGALQANSTACSGGAHAACSGSIAGARSNDNTSPLAVRLRFLLSCLSQRQEWQQQVQDALAAATATAFQRWGYSSGGGAPPSSTEDTGPVPLRMVSDPGIVPQPLLGSVAMPLSADLSVDVLRYGQPNL